MQEVFDRVRADLMAGRTKRRRHGEGCAERPPRGPSGARQYWTRRDGQSAGRWVEKKQLVHEAGEGPEGEREATASNPRSEQKPTTALRGRRLPYRTLARHASDELAGPRRGRSQKGIPEVPPLPAPAENLPPLEDEF